MATPPPSPPPAAGPLRIGITYDIFEDVAHLALPPEATADFAEKITVDAIAAVLSARGHVVERIGNVYELVKRLARVQTPIDRAGVRASFARDHARNIGEAAVAPGQDAAERWPPWDLVFNIAEGMHGRAREAQIPALLDA
jgi:D-alanine-D-alanine ligase